MEKFLKTTGDNLVRSAIIIGTNVGTAVGLSYFTRGSGGFDQGWGNLITAVFAAIPLMASAKYSAISSLAHYASQDKTIGLNIAGNLVVDAAMTLYSEKGIEFGTMLLAFDCINFALEAGINTYILYD